MLNINIVDETGVVGIELVCDVHWRAAKDVWTEQARLRLSRATDELQIRDDSDSTHIVASIWLTQDEMRWIK